MIKIINGNLFNSKANFIVHQTNCVGVMGAGVAKQVADLFPHVEKEYIRYVEKCKKENIDILGNVQYVPVDTAGTQYIVNLFGQRGFGKGLQTDIKALKKGFLNICDKAKEIGATVAMPYKIGSFRGGADWNDVYAIINDVFGDGDVNVEIWKYDKE